MILLFTMLSENQCEDKNVQNYRETLASVKAWLGYSLSKRVESAGWPASLISDIIIIILGDVLKTWYVWVGGGIWTTIGEGFVIWWSQNSCNIAWVFNYDHRYRKLIISFGMCWRHDMCECGCGGIWTTIEEGFVIWSENSCKSLIDQPWSQI